MNEDSFEDQVTLRGPRRSRERLCENNKNFFTLLLQALHGESEYISLLDDEDKDFRKLIKRRDEK